MDPERLPSPSRPWRVPRRCLGRHPAQSPRRWEPWLVGFAVRVKVDLQVSGLKSDSPPRLGIAGSAPAGVRAQEPAVCRNSRLSPQQANGRPSAGLRNDFSSDKRESACKPGVFLEPPAVGQPRVRNQSDPTQTHKPTAHPRKTCKYRSFRERLMGFEPTTFCMASSTCASHPAPNHAANKPLFAPAWARRNPRHSPGNHGGFRTQTGPSLLVPEPIRVRQACGQESAQSRLRRGAGASSGTRDVRPFRQRWSGARRLLSEGTRAFRASPRKRRRRSHH
jgi:hypothetical protein